jgi:hypothetical protein
MIQGVIARYEDDQVVVAISDRAVARGALTDLPVGEQDVDPSPELGLALLTLQDVASGAAELRALHKRVKEAKRPAVSPKGIAPSDLDTLIFWLRELGAPRGPRELRFSNRFARWEGTSFAGATVSGAVAAKIQPGRCEARQALTCICEEPGGEIRRFVKPDR